MNFFVYIFFCRPILTRRARWFHPNGMLGFSFFSLFISVSFFIFLLLLSISLVYVETWEPLDKCVNTFLHRYNCRILFHSIDIFFSLRSTTPPIQSTDSMPSYRRVHQLFTLMPSSLSNTLSQPCQRSTHTMLLQLYTTLLQLYTMLLQLVCLQFDLCIKSGKILLPFFRCCCCHCCH